jgi:hypothetical protein
VDRVGCDLYVRTLAGRAGCGLTNRGFLSRERTQGGGRAWDAATKAWVGLNPACGTALGSAQGFKDVAGAKSAALAWRGPRIVDGLALGATVDALGDGISEFGSVAEQLNAPRRQHECVAAI